MPLESAAYISTLDPSQPLGTDPIASADDHIRLIKAVLKATFPNLTGPVTATNADINTHLVPSGAIIMWAGTVDQIPSGWFLCNGQNNTPDLRDRFIVAAGGQYAPYATGGSISKGTSASGVHTHPMTPERLGGARVAAGDSYEIGLSVDHVHNIDVRPPYYALCFIAKG